MGNRTFLSEGYPVHLNKADDLLSPLSEGSGDVEPATALLWTYYYLAHHFDQLRQLQRAMEFVDLGLEHTPLLIELYVLKAKILKVRGADQAEFILI